MNLRKNLRDINDFILSQIIGVQQSQLKRDDLYKDLEIVNCFDNKQSIIIHLKNINKRTTYNKNLLKYVEYLISYHNLNINIKKIHKWAEDDFDKFKDITHKHFWNYRINLFKEGWLKIKEKKIKEKQSLNWGFADSSINDYLNSIPSQLACKAYNILINSNKDEIYSLIYSCDDINEINNYKELIFENDSLLNKLFNIEENKGSGKGEALLTFLIKGKTLGLSSRYDVLLHNNSKVEIKSTNQSFRFGTKASIGNYEFYSNIIKSRNVLLSLINQIGLEEFRSLVSKDFFEISSLLIKEGDYTKELALSTSIDSAEISEKKLSLIKLWFFMAFIETYKYDYSYSIKQDIFSELYETVDNDKCKLINVLRSLKYVKDPLKLNEDLDIEIKKCFKDINYLVIFKEREKQISIITSPIDIMIDGISQNGIKVIERKQRNRKDYLKESFILWNENKNENFYDLYTKLKMNVNVLLSPELVS